MTDGRGGRTDSCHSGGASAKPDLAIPPFGRSRRSLSWASRQLLGTKVGQVPCQEAPPRIGRCSAVLGICVRYRSLPFHLNKQSSEHTQPDSGAGVGSTGRRTSEPDLEAPLRRWAAWLCWEYNARAHAPSSECQAGRD